MSFLQCLAIPYQAYDLELFISPLSLSEHGFIQTQTNVYLENTTGHFDAIVNIINLPVPHGDMLVKLHISFLSIQICNVHTRAALKSEALKGLTITCPQLSTRMCTSK